MEEASKFAARNLLNFLTSINSKIIFYLNTVLITMHYRSQMVLQRSLRSLNAEKVNSALVTVATIANTNKIIKNYIPSPKTWCTMVTVFGRAKTCCTIVVGSIMVWLHFKSSLQQTQNLLLTKQSGYRLVDIKLSGWTLYDFQTVSVQG